MVMVNFIIKMVGCMMVIGDRIRWRDLGNCSINLGSWLMRVNGRMISLWVKVYYIMNYQIFWINLSIIIILMMSKNTGLNIKVNTIYIYRIIRR